MTPADAARILAIAAIYDRRTVGELDARAWADALTSLDPRDCAEAVREHYRDSTDWLMPAHVRAGVRTIRRHRLETAPPDLFEPPESLDPNDVPGYIAWRRGRIHAIANGDHIDPEPRGPWRDVEGLARQTLAQLPQVTSKEPTS